MSRLLSLSLRQSVALTNHGVFSLVTNIPTLSSLDLSWCDLIADASIENITLSLVHLRELRLNHCKKISDRGVRKMLLEEHKKGGKRCLRRVDASSCPSIFVTDRKFIKVVEKARRDGVVVLLEGSGRL